MLNRPSPSAPVECALGIDGSTPICLPTSDSSNCMADGCQQIGDYALGASAFENAHSVFDDNSDSSDGSCSNYGDVTSDSDNDVYDIDIDKPAINVQLAEWAVENRISHSAIGSMLSILKTYHGCLPVDP